MHATCPTSLPNKTFCSPSSSYVYTNFLRAFVCSLTSKSCIGCEQLTLTSSKKSEFPRPGCCYSRKCVWTLHTECQLFSAYVWLNTQRRSGKFLENLYGYCVYTVEGKTQYMEGRTWQIVGHSTLSSLGLNKNRLIISGSRLCALCHFSGNIICLKGVRGLDFI